MSAQIISQSPVNFKKTDSNVIQFNNGRKHQPMPEDAFDNDMFIMQTQAIKQAEKKERSRENWNKANTIFSGMIGVGVLGSLVAMVIANRRSKAAMNDAIDGIKRQGEEHMGDSIVRFKEIVKDSLPKLDSDSINPKTREFIKMIKDRLSLSEDVAKYSGSKAAEQCLLIHGTTGTGKTFSARILANELGAEYTEIDFPKIASPYVGQASANIRKVFENAAEVLKANPDKRYVMVFNEIDSMLIPMGHASAEKAHVLENRTAFLNGLDLMKEYKNITIVGTTNANPKSGNLDFAALGRFGNIFEIELPTEKEIIAALKWHLKDCEGATKYDFFKNHKSEIESFAKKLRNEKYSQRDVEKLAGMAQTRFGIEIGKKSNPLDEKFDIKYLEEAFKYKGDTTGSMQSNLKGNNNGGKLSAWQRFKAGIGFWLFGGK